MHSTAIMILLCSGLLFASLSTSSLVVTSQIQLPLAQLLATDEKLSDSPFVGIDLTAGYGTVSVALQNGTTYDVARLEGSSKYKDLMARLSLESSEHLSPPYRGMDESWADAPRQSLRRMRKACGLPASADVGTLAKMIKALREAAETFLGQKVESALAVTPQLTALYWEDIEDAFQYLKLTDVDDRDMWYPVTQEPVAAAAGSGLNLCPHPEDPIHCREHEAAIENSVALSVLYTRTALCVEIGIIKGFRYGWSSYPTSPPSMDFTLGSDELHNNPNEEYYWQAVRERIGAALSERVRLDRRLDKILLFGESIPANDEFRQQLLQIVETIVGRSMTDIEVYDQNPVFRVAQGAALIARRKALIPATEADRMDL